MVFMIGLLMVVCCNRKVCWKVLVIILLLCIVVILISGVCWMCSIIGFIIGMVIMSFGVVV